MRNNVSLYGTQGTKMGYCPEPLECGDIVEYSKGADMTQTA